MRSTQLLFALACLANTLSAQDVYTIKADSVKLTGCDSSELIIENHTQAVSGFLYNTGKGRTIFKRGALKLNDSMYLVGADTVRLGSNWLQGGNSFGRSGILGTLDNNNLDFYTHDSARVRVDNTGGLQLLTNLNDNIYFRGIRHGLVVTDSNKIVLPRAGGAQGGFFFTDITQNSWVFYNGSPIPLNKFTLSANELRLYSSYGSINPGGAYYSVNWVYNGTTTDLNGNPASNLTVNIGGNLQPTQAYYNGSNVVLTGSTSGNTANVNWYGYPGSVTVKGGDAYPGTLNFPGANAYVSGGYGNGAGSPGDVIISTATKLDSGSTAQSVSPRMYVKGHTGYVGIGTSTPSAQFHTTGTVRFAGLTSDTTKTHVIVSDASGNLYYRDASTLAVNGILNAELANVKAVLPSLAVNGTISAQRLKLSQAGWPDYVFALNYDLPTLPYLERYITQNGHLPGIPSAAEVEQKGIDVGDHQAALLKKIEELTLYSIGQDKKLNAQQQEIDGLKQAIADLKKIITDQSLK